ncbi:MAG: exopolysaccharide biosynthesis polyprenyl glycosylphosphotransferase, partial [Chitinophagales bacterium]
QFKDNPQSAAFALEDYKKGLEKRFNLHNQFFETLIEIGVLGVSLLIGLVIYILCFFKHNQSIRWLMLLVVFFALFESVLETQAGLVFIVFFMSIFSKVNARNKIKCTFEVRMNGKQLKFFGKLILVFVDVVLLLSIFYWYVDYAFGDTAYVLENEHKIFVWVLYLLFSWFLVGIIFMLYSLDSSLRLSEVVLRVFFTSVLFNLLYLYTPVLTPHLPENRLPVFFFISTTFIAIALWRLLFTVLYKRIRARRRAIILGEYWIVENVFDAIIDREKNDNYELYKVVALASDKPVSGDKYILKKRQLKYPNRLLDYCKRLKVDDLILAYSSRHLRTSQWYSDILECQAQGINIRSAIDVFEERSGKLMVGKENNQYYLVENFAQYSKNRRYYVFNRLLNVLIAVFGLVFTILTIPFIALFNFFLNKGPLFYTQERVGKQNKIFEIIKFRTMVTDAEKDGAQWAEKNDSRITPFGRFMRKTRLDELPQFWNLLKGDMNLIGPRPERQFFIDQLSEKIPFFGLRNMVKPGLTGWAQIKYKYGNTEKDSLHKLQYDLFYIKRRSLMLDLKIVLKTISVMLKFKGN